MSNFEVNRTQIPTVRVPQRKLAKWPLWRHRFRNVKIWEKRTSQISVRSFVENLIKFGSAVWAVALTQTHAHTHTHTHTLGSIATYSVKMTEYKKEKCLYENVDSYYNWIKFILSNFLIIFFRFSLCLGENVYMTIFNCPPLGSFIPFLERLCMPAASVCFWTPRLSVSHLGSFTSVHELKCTRTQTAPCLMSLADDLALPQE